MGKRFFTKYSKYFIAQKGLTFGLGLSFYFIFGADGIILGLVLSYVHFTIPETVPATKESRINVDCN